MGSYGFPRQPRTMLREAAAGGADPIRHPATSYGTSQSCRTSTLTGSFKQGDRIMSGHFAGGYEVEALTCENSVTCVRTTRGRQIAYPCRACVGKTASVSKK